ncbi:PcfJ domain-containing protein [Fusobacterium sp. THCT1E2]
MYNKIFFDSDYDLNLGYLIRKKGERSTSAVSKKLQLKDLAKFKNGIRKIVLKNYLEYLGETNYLIKDILEDYISDPIKISVPIDFKLLENAKNKKHLLELKTRKQGLFNRFNKISLNFSYTILKVLKHINEKELNKIILKEILIEGSEREKINQFFLKYYKEHITDISPDDYSDERHVLYDYIFMVRQLKRKFNLDITTIKKLYKEHDRIAEFQRIKDYKKMELKIKPNNPFLQLELPEEFKMLETKEEFFNEGKENNNCVFTYIPSVNEENCIIYTTLYKDKKYTIEFGKKRTQFVLRQIKGYGNSEAPEELIEYIVKCIKDQRITDKKGA